MFLKLSPRSFHRLCLLTLFTCLFVILWGAWVRFSHSGDGCGANWPLCNNELIPNVATQKTWIEWFHRVSSAFFGFLVLILVLCSFQSFEKKHKVRFWSLLTLFFTITEALIGAILVLASLTGQNDSFIRLIILNAHLINSLFLTASITFCWRFSFGKIHICYKKLLWGSAIFIIIALTGSIASLSNTLFPSSSLIDGFVLDFSSHSPLILKLRVFHPILALTFGITVLYYLFSNGILNKLYFSIRYSQKNSTNIVNLSILIIIALLTGTITLITLSPIPLKLVHLFIAHLIWLSIMLF